MLERRDVLQAFGAAALLAPFVALEEAAAALAETLPPASRQELAHGQLASVPGLKMEGSEQIAMLLYPGFTALDLVGPHYFFACMMGAKVHLVTPGKTREPVASDLGLAIQPTVTLAETPRELDILFVPGGTTGTVAAMKRRDITEWLASQGSRAKLVTSVCTGSMLLGKAGLLRNKRATSHWATRPLLPDVGATPVEARVVVDDNVITGAGVSAGIDLALAIVERFRGRPYAQALMLQAEYDPQPPFRGGSLALTPEEIAGPMAGIFSGFVEQFRIAANP